MTANYRELTANGSAQLAKLRLDIPDTTREA